MNYQLFLILEIKDILCEKEPMPQNNEVYGSSYVEHHLNISVVDYSFSEKDREFIGKQSYRRRFTANGCFWTEVANLREKVCLASWFYLKSCGRKEKFVKCHEEEKLYCAGPGVQDVYEI